MPSANISCPFHRILCVSTHSFRVLCLTTPAHSDFSCLVYLHTEKKQWRNYFPPNAINGWECELWPIDLVCSHEKQKKTKSNTFCSLSPISNVHWVCVSRLAMICQKKVVLQFERQSEKKWKPHRQPPQISVPRLQRIIANRAYVRTRDFLITILSNEGKCLCMQNSDENGVARLNTTRCRRTHASVPHSANNFAAFFNNSDSDSSKKSAPPNFPHVTDAQHRQRWQMREWKSNILMSMSMVCLWFVSCCRLRLNRSFLPCVRSRQIAFPVSDTHNERCQCQPADCALALDWVPARHVLWWHYVHVNECKCTCT